jgi:hypothetical protein
VTDDRLRSELQALEHDAPTSAAPVGAAHSPISALRLGLIGATVLAGIALTSLALGQVRTSSPLGNATAEPNPPAAAQARNGDIVLTLSSPKTTWTTDEAIEIAATINYVGELAEVDLHGGGGPIVFSLRQLSGGDAVLGGGQDLPCLTYPVKRNDPLEFPFAKSGAVDDSRPFDRAFFDDPVLRLPAGRWEVVAWLQYGIGECDDLNMEVSIELEVVAEGGPSVSAEPTRSGKPVPTQSPRACMAALASGTLDADDQRRPILILGNDRPPALIVFPDSVRVDPGPPLTIFDPFGNVFATEGDRIELGGGFNADDSAFHACGVEPVDRIDPTEGEASEPAGQGNVVCHVAAEDCELAIDAATAVLEDATELRTILVGPGRGLRIWHAEVHACWNDGRYQLIDVLGRIDVVNPSLDDVTASVRDQPWDDPPCY